MATISRTLTNAKGKTFTLSTADSAGLPTATRLVEANEGERLAVAEALKAFDEGRLDAARGLLLAYAGQATWPATLVTLARIDMSEGDLEAADRRLAEAEALFPQEPQLWKALAILRRSQNRAVDELRYRRHLVVSVPRAAKGAHVAYAQTFLKAYGKADRPPLAELRLIAESLFRALRPDAESQQERLEFAQLLYESKVLQAEARRLYAQASPCPANERDVSVVWLPMQLWCDRIAIDYRRSTEHGMPRRRPTLAQLSRVAVLPSMQWAPVLDEVNTAIDGFLTHPFKLRSEDSGSPILLSRKEHRAELRLPKELPLIERPALLLGGEPGYQRHTLRHLSSLAVAELLDAPADLPLVVNDELAPFQHEQFELLGIEPSRLLRLKANQAVRFAQLWTPSPLVSRDRWVDPLLPQWHRRRLVSAQAQVGRRLYVVSRSPTRHTLSNEGAVITLLQQLGYEIVQPYPSNSVAQQIERFSQASHIVGLPTEALTDMIYAAPGTKIVVLLADRHAALEEPVPSFQALAKACGHKFDQVECLPAGTGSAALPTRASVDVDLEKLRSALAD